MAMKMKKRGNPNADTGKGAKRMKAVVDPKKAELEKNMAFLQGEGNWLQLIDGALDKFERGVYGICESCANPIGKPRLMAKPFAQYCIECRRKQETGGQAAS